MLYEQPIDLLVVSRAAKACVEFQKFAPSAARGEEPEEARANVVGELPVTALKKVIFKKIDPIILQVELDKLLCQAELPLIRGLIQTVTYICCQALEEESRRRVSDQGEVEDVGELVENAGLCTIFGKIDGDLIDFPRFDPID